MTAKKPNPKKAKSRLDSKGRFEVEGISPDFDSEGRLTGHSVKWDWKDPLDYASKTPQTWNGEEVPKSVSAKRMLAQEESARDAALKAIGKASVGVQDEEVVLSLSPEDFEVICKALGEEQ
jgi:hypothetical protein